MKGRARVPLRIAFDLDGVLADMDSELARQAVTLFGEQATTEPREARSESREFGRSGPSGPSGETSEPGEPREPSEPTLELP